MTIVRILATVCALLFAALTAVVAAQPELALDLTLRWPATQHTGWLDITATVIRFAASQLPLIAVLPLTVVLLWRKRRRDSLLLLTSFAAVLVTSVAVKLAVARPRPLQGVSGFPAAADETSYPSTSVALCVIFWGLLAAFHRSLRLLAITFMALIGISRSYADDHWATDILGGYLIGASALATTLWIYHRKINDGRLASYADERAND